MSSVLRSPPSTSCDSIVTPGLPEDHTTTYTTPSATSSGLWFIPDRVPLPPRNRCGPSHSTRKPFFHIPRPRNAFILFRSHFHTMQVLPTDLDFCRDHRQISRIVSFVWASLPIKEKKRFFRLSEEELLVHQKNYPLFVIPAKETKQKLNKYEASHKGGHLSPEELHCKRIAELILSGFQKDELALKIQELAPVYATRKAPHQIRRGEDNMVDAPMPLDITLNDTGVVREEGPTPYAGPAGLRQAGKLGKLASSPKPKRRSSISISKMSRPSMTVSIYQRMVNPPRRHRAQVSYAEDGSDGEISEDWTSSTMFHTESLIACGNDQSIPPFSDSEDSLTSVSRQALDPDPICDAMDAPSAIHKPADHFVSWIEEEASDNAFKCDDLINSSDLESISRHFELNTSWVCDEETNVYDLEYQIFAERGRTPFVPDVCSLEEAEVPDCQEAWMDYLILG
ncbi:hypothetical protein FRB91_000631 [Serendipita sp. 411]|nr:hypothetical protein FRB91_000631 [Serendipita sp. 411]